MISYFLNTYLRFFFLLTPFFVVSSFISMTGSMSLPQRHSLALRVTTAIMIASLVIALIGNYVFLAFDITLDAFRVGTGVLLFYNAFTLVHGSRNLSQDQSYGNDDLAVVPLAIPITVGPATTGALMVLGTELDSVEKIAAGLGGIALAIISVGALLYTSTYLDRALGKRGLSIMSKLTGLILSALAAQLILTGIGNTL
ncbi:MAG: MarC family protein [Spirochaetales bacterium]|nr:MarC family protein [Spirochaetales bacterium]